MKSKKSKIAKTGDKVIYTGNLYHHMDYLLVKKSIYIVKDISVVSNRCGYIFEGFDITFNFGEFKKLSEYRKLKLEKLNNLK